MRAFAIIGAAVAIFWLATFYILGNRSAHTGESGACRNEQILLAVSRNQHAIGEIVQEGNDLVIEADWRRWMALNLKRRSDIGLAAWCVVALESKGGMVRIISGGSEVGRVEQGKWTSRFGG